jgi:hypothetical protein
VREGLAEVGDDRLGHGLSCAGVGQATSATAMASGPVESPRGRQAVRAQFTLRGFDHFPAMNTVYLENGRGGRYLDGEAGLERDRLRDLALSPANPRTRLTTVMRHL